MREDKLSVNIITNAGGMRNDKLFVNIITSTAGRMRTSAGRMGNGKLSVNIITSANKEPDHDGCWHAQGQALSKRHQCAKERHGQHNLRNLALLSAQQKEACSVPRHGGNCLVGMLDPCED